MSIELNHVSFSYGDHLVLKDLSLSLPEKGFVVILGQSGSGKTTFLHLISGNLAPTSGVMKLDIENVMNVYQDPLLLNYLTVKENIFLPLWFSNHSHNEIDKETTPLLKQLNLESSANKYPYQLSGGEQVRVAIARALIKKKPILVLDEPTGQLDEENSERIYTILEELSKDHLIILVTHDEINGIKRASHLYRLEHHNLNLIKGERASPSKIQDVASKPKNMSLINGILLNYKYLRKKKLRVLFSVLFLSLNMVFVFLGLNLARHFDTGLNALLNDYYASDVIRLSMKENIAEKGSLHLSKNSSPSEEVLSVLRIDKTFPQLTHFIPSVFDTTILNKNVNVNFDPVINQSQNKLKRGRRIESYDEVVINESLLEEIKLPEEQAINKTLLLSHQVLIYSSQFSQTDLLSFTLPFHIVGISKEKKAFNLPRAYYSYSLILDHLKEYYLPHISEELDTHLTAYDLIIDPLYRKEDIQGNGILFLSTEPYEMEDRANHYFKDKVLISSSSLKVKKNTKEIVSSLLEVLTVFIFLNMITAVLFEFLAVYSLYEENIRTFALIKAFTRNKNNLFRHAASLLFLLFGSVLFISGILSVFSVQIIGLVLNHFEFPQFLSSFDLFSFLIVIILSFLASIIGCLLPLKKIKDSALNKELEGED